MLKWICFSKSILFLSSMGSRLIVYGDIHGCLKELTLLRKSLNIQKSDIEVTVGDFLTKGKNSIGVLRYIQQNNILSVLGNHEDKLHRFMMHQDNNNEKNPIILNDDEKKVVKGFSSDDIFFISKLPLFLRYGSITVLHAGLLNHQKLDSLSKKDEKRLLRLRYLDNKGKFLTIDQEDENSIFWADAYDGNEGFIVYGHQFFEEAYRSPNALGIDTGCAYGNKLTAAIFIDLDISNYTLCSMPATIRAV